MYVGGMFSTAAEIHGTLASLEVIAIPRQWGLVEHVRDESNSAQSEGSGDGCAIKRLTT